jgi:serine/threonine protein kinase
MNGSATLERKKFAAEGGEYIITERLGKGGMGTVWGATYVKGNILSPVAIKVLHGALALTDDANQRFENEARIAGQLKHPGIPGLYDYAKYGGAPVLVMERVDGRDIRSFQDCHISLADEAVYIVGQTCSALAYAHDRTIGGADAGVVHSDVTPGNIMITSDGGVVLTDFGIARYASADHTRSRPIGTLRYMSPEQRTGRTPRATDIFSLGVILHELLDGKRYLADLDDHLFTQAILNGHIPALERRDVPPWLDGLRRQMLAPRPEDRPRAVDIRTRILEQTPHYMLAAERLKEVYADQFGGRRSGMSKYWDFKRLFDNQNIEPLDLEMFEFSSGASIRAASAGEKTAADRGRAKQDDAAAARQLTDVGEPAKPSAGEVTRETNTHDGQRSRWAQEPKPPSLITVAEPRPAALPVSTHAYGHGPAPTPAPAPEASPAQQVMPEPTPAPATELVFGDGASSGEPTQVLEPVGPAERATTAERSSPARPVVGAAPRNTVALWLLIGVASVIVVLLGIIAHALLTSEPPSGPTAPPTVAAAEGPEQLQQEQEPPPVAPIEPTVDPLPPVEPVEEPSVDPPVEPKPETTPELVPEDEPEPAPKPKPTTDKPKPKPKPKIPVVFRIPSMSGQAEIEVGKTKHAYKYVAKADLRPGTYPVRWRTLPDGPWHAIDQRLTVEELPSDKGYSVELSTKGMKVDTTRRGTAK